MPILNGNCFCKETHIRNTLWNFIYDQTSRLLMIWYVLLYKKIISNTQIRVWLKFDLKDWISACPLITEDKLERKPRIILWLNRKSRVFNWKTLLNWNWTWQNWYRWFHTHLLTAIISGRNNIHTRFIWFEQKTYWFIIIGANGLTPVWISLSNGTSSAKCFTRFHKTHT